jgi:hypothetical protein
MTPPPPLPQPLLEALLSAPRQMAAVRPSNQWLKMQQSFEMLDDCLLLFVRFWVI